MRRRLMRNAKVLVGGVIVLVVILAALLAGVLATHNPETQSLMARLLPPGTPRYVLGTDGLGRDILSRILFGARISLVIAVVAVIISTVLGTALGLISGYYGRLLDSLIMRLVDTQLAIPYLVLAIAIVTIFGPGITHLIFVMVLGGWVYYARVVRGSVLSLRQTDYVQAARSIGVPDVLIILRHILPNLLSSVIVIATLQVGQMILTTATLSFLGLGIPANIPSWGAMAADGQDYLATAWWIATMPGFAIFLTTIGFNYLGDGIREILDPKVRI